MAKVIASLQERSKNLNELAAGARFFFAVPDSYDEKTVNKNFKDETWPLLEEFVAKASALGEWSGEAAHGLITSICEDAEVGMGKLAQPIRVLAAGVPVSPPIDATLELLGKEETLARLRRGIDSLKA